MSLHRLKSNRLETMIIYNDFIEMIIITLLLKC